MSMSFPLFSGKTRPTNPDLLTFKPGDAARLVKTTRRPDLSEGAQKEITDVFIKEIKGHQGAEVNGVQVPDYVAEQDDRADLVVLADKAGVESAYLMGSYVDSVRGVVVEVDAFKKDGNLYKRKGQAQPYQKLQLEKPEPSSFDFTNPLEGLRDLFGGLPLDEILQKLNLDDLKQADIGLPVSLEDLKTFFGDLSKGKLSLPLDKTFAIMNFLNDKGVDPAKLLELMAKVKPAMDKAKETAKGFSDKGSPVKGLGSILEMLKPFGGDKLIEDAKKAIESSRSSLPEPLQGLVDKLLEKLESGKSEDPQDGDSGQS